MSEEKIRRTLPIILMLFIALVASGCSQATPTVVGDPEDWLPKYLCGDYEAVEGDNIFSHIIEIPGLLELPEAEDHWNQTYWESQTFWPLGNRVNMSYNFFVLESMVLNNSTPPTGSEYYAVNVSTITYGEYKTTILLRDNLTLMVSCNDTRKPIDAEPLFGEDRSYDPIPGYNYDPGHIEQGWVVFEAPANFTEGKLLVFYSYEYGVTGAWNL